MNPYEVLDIARNASAAEIKQQWRALTWQNHPDRNPDGAAKMADINQAYEILSDPEKRRNYDETGALAMPPTFDLKVRHSAMEAIQIVLNGPDQNIPDLLDAAKKLIQGRLNELSAESQNLRAKRARLHRAKEQITTSHEQNVFHMVIDQQLETIEVLLKKNYEIDDIVSGAFKLLQHYENHPEFIPFPTQFIYIARPP